MNSELGISGCKISLVKINGKDYVMKSTDDPEYALRLNAQATKQYHASFAIAANPFLSAQVRVPIVEEISNGHFIMEYLPYMSYVDFVETSSVKEVRNGVDRVLGFLDYCFIYNNQFQVDVNDFVLGSLEKALDTPHITGVVRQMCSKAYVLFQKVRLPMIRGGECHGDLTMSNVMFSKENIALIDWHDRVPSSPIFDLIKLRQDALYDWTSCVHGKKHDVNKVRLINGYMDATLRERFGKLINGYVFVVLEAINYVRILQYTQGKACNSLVEAASVYSLEKVLRS